jgi:hypothetical protein|tara:strand:- start:251 stop:451 length:201 start_codon:yes stop_codon:yes gene_type:complete
MATTVFDVLVKKSDEDISSATQFLAGGSAKDFAGYKEIVGLIRGLEASKQHIEDLSRSYTEENDDD